MVGGGPAQPSGPAGPSCSSKNSASLVRQLEGGKFTLSLPRGQKSQRSNHPVGSDFSVLSPALKAKGAQGWKERGVRAGRLVDSKTTYHRGGLGLTSRHRPEMGGGGAWGRSRAPFPG